METDGTVTKGHHVEKDEIWFSKLAEWLDWFYGVQVDFVEVDEVEAVEASKANEDKEVVGDVQEVEVEAMDETKGGEEVEEVEHVVAEPDVEEVEGEEQAAEANAGAEETEPDTDVEDPMGAETETQAATEEEEDLVEDRVEETRSDAGGRPQKKRKMAKRSRRIQVERRSIEYVNGAKPGMSPLPVSSDHLRCFGVADAGRAA